MELISVILGTGLFIMIIIYIREGYVMRKLHEKELKLKRFEIEQKYK